MDSILELDKAINQGLDQFKTYIKAEIEKQPDFLEHFFWAADASQRTALNYLIHLYQEPKDDVDLEANPLLPMIKHVVTLMDDKNIGTPIHQAISEGKEQLAIDLLALTPQVEPEPQVMSLNTGIKIVKKNKMK
jgi:hypothetical protein